MSCAAAKSPMNAYVTDRIYISITVLLQYIALLTVSLVTKSSAYYMPSLAIIGWWTHGPPDSTDTNLNIALLLKLASNQL